MNPHRGLLHHLNLNVSNLARSSLFYGPVLRYLGYELSDSSNDADYGHEHWKRWELDTPHEICLCQADRALPIERINRRSVGRFTHFAFCAEDRADVDRFYAEVLVPLERAGLCAVEDPPCECPEYNEGYYATFFFDPDGLKYEFVINPNHLKKKHAREGKARS